MRSGLLGRSFAGMVLWTLAIGCQSSTTTSKTDTPALARNATLDQAVDTDACAIRLGDITAALTMYYGLNKQLPDSLEELKPLANPNGELLLTCPVSGQPYVYSPAGLLAIGTSKRIIVWDATPAHDGSRWCILMPPTQPGAAVSLELVALRESAFKMYVPAIQ